jgi:hypothetical protein
VGSGGGPLLLLSARAVAGVRVLLLSARAVAVRERRANLDILEIDFFIPRLKK